MNKLISLARAMTLRHCTEHYKFFGSGILNHAYFCVIKAIRSSYLEA